MKYSFEREWRIVRLLKRLEHNGDGVFRCPFDPASICRIIIRPTCSVESELRRLVSSNERYRHMQIELQKDDSLVYTPV